MRTKTTTRPKCTVGGGAAWTYAARSTSYLHDTRVLIFSRMRAAEPSNAEMLGAFMAFPAPLAFLGPDGRPERLNATFRKQFAEESLDPVVLRALAMQADGNPRQVRLSSGAPSVQVRTLRTPFHILLIVDTEHGGVDGVELDALRARIGDLEKLVATDHLTGAWNRAHLDRVIASELPRSLASRLPLSLVLFDIDNFKRVNDTFGHAVGDSVLCELVRLVASRTRASDILFRWGGEEFVVLVSSAGYRRASVLAENLRQIVAGHSFESAGVVTISLGVAEHDGDEDSQAWFRRLDSALYEAKEAGRNRVAVSRRGNSDVWAANAGSSALHLIWQEGYECGEPTIDGEHRELFRLANALIDVAVDKGGADPMGSASAGSAAEEAMDALLAHVQHHFADEEAILERMQFAHLAEHRRAHAGLLKRASVLRERVRSGEARLGAIVEFLAQDVVARHMIAMDQAFFPLFAGPISPSRGAEGV